MPVFFNLLFLSCAGLLGLLALVAIWWLPSRWLTRGRSKRARYLMLAAVLPLYIAAIIVYYVYMSRDDVVFQRLVGFPPPAEVTELHTTFSALGDSGSGYMRFHCTRATADRIVASRKGMTRKDHIQT